MRPFSPARTGRGMLATAIALLSGSALAEVAGRVTFVSGDAAVRTADGSLRTLQRGDAINGGERILTRAGRVQISFTDGGFVSLQPNTEFGVDEYAYSNRKPEESSLFFSLLRGGMRTITGAIGKANKRNYKVRTTVATIGIRGTEYLAQLTEQGLKVSVGAGFVYVENAAGNVTGGAGQNIAVPRADLPPVLSQERAELRAPDVEEDRRRLEALLAESRQQGESVAIGDVRNEQGEYLFLSDAAAFTSGPGYAMAYAYTAAGSSVSNQRGGYDATATGGSDTTMHLLFNGKGALEQAYQYGNPVFDFSQAADKGSNAVGGLKWGSWGMPNVDAPSVPVLVDGSPSTLGFDEYAHYVVGRLTPLNDFLTIASGASATYRLQGGTLATGTDGSTGLLTPGSQITVYFYSAPQLSFNIGVAMSDNVTYGLTGTTTATMTVVPASASTPAYLSGTPTFAASSLGCSGASSGGCSAAVSGFFAGAQARQIGLSYEISDPGAGRTVNGAAAFGRGAITGPLIGN